MQHLTLGPYERKIKGTAIVIVEGHIHERTELMKYACRSIVSIALYATFPFVCSCATINDRSDVVYDSSKYVVLERKDIFVNLVAVDGEGSLFNNNMFTDNIFLLSPGIHTIVVTYKRGMLRGSNKLKLNFTATLGHRYILEPNAFRDMWNPNIKDLTTGMYIGKLEGVVDLFRNE